MEQSAVEILKAAQALAPDAWTALVEHRKADAVAGILMAIVGLAFSLMGYLKGREWMNAPSSRLEVEGAFGAIVSAIGIIFFTGMALDCVVTLNYPEGAVVKQLINAATRK